jgi:predicted lipoprotein with Yx(FWY)xxD motif
MSWIAFAPARLEAPGAAWFAGPMRRILAAVLTAAVVTAGCGGDPTASDDASGDGAAGPSAGTSGGPTTRETEPAEPEPTDQTQPTDPTTDPTTDGSPARTPSRPSSADGTVVTTAGSDFGTMLFDRSGQAIYLFDKERSSRARCYGACAAAWPPVLARGVPRAAGQVRDGLLGTTTRRDGSRQVTYNGHPLYYYADEGKHEVLCHDVREYGGLWLVVTPRGEPAPA